MSNPSEVNLNSLGVMGIKTERAGPRLLVLGAVHGNETCGPRAIERVMADFDSEKLQLVRGNVTFVPITNPLAYQRGQRIGERNLNRNLRVTTEPKDYEDRIANALCPLIGQHDAVLDLHSFQSPGEPFAMIGPTTNEDDLEPFAFSMPEEALALRLGVRRFVHGWMPTYAAGVAKRIKRAAESGLPGFDVTAWHGVLAPAKTPPAIIAKLNREIVRILELPDVQETLLAEGGDITPTTPQEFAALIRSELQLWIKVVKQAGITLE